MWTQPECFAFSDMKAKVPLHPLPLCKYKQDHFYLFSLAVGGAGVSWEKQKGLAWGFQPKCDIKSESFTFHYNPHFPFWGSLELEQGHNNSSKTVSI